MTGRRGPREEPQLPLFPLVRGSEQECHALAPGAEAGAGLCSAVEPEGGWTHVERTSRLYLIDCHNCRQLAAEIVAGHGDGDATREVAR